MQKNLLYFLLIYYIVINIYSYLLMYIDKRKARKHKYRIPERSLMTISLLGGAFGSYLSMKHFRHKTLHKKFTIGIPAIMLVHIFGIVYILIIKYL